ncbi:Protein lin-10 [Halotydeus destructor]|nr:Protein lin-10 [Halotydeus destructor]
MASLLTVNGSNRDHDQVVMENLFPKCRPRMSNTPNKTRRRRVQRPKVRSGHISGVNRKETQQPPSCDLLQLEDSQPGLVATRKMSNSTALSLLSLRRNSESSRDGDGEEAETHAVIEVKSIDPVPVLPPTLAGDEARELNKSLPSTCPPSPAKDSDIIGHIGNLPIASYEESPRRYGPKPPGYPQRIFPSKSADEVPVKQEDSLMSITCDELVKSILNIPTTSLNEASSPSPSSSSKSSKLQSNDNSMEENTGTLIDITSNPMLHVNACDDSLTDCTQLTTRGTSENNVCAVPVQSNPHEFVRKSKVFVNKQHEVTNTSEKVMSASTTRIDDIGSNEHSRYFSRKNLLNEKSSDETSPSSEDGTFLDEQHTARKPVLDSPAAQSDQGVVVSDSNKTDEILLLHDRVNQHLLQDSTISVDAASPSLNKPNNVEGTPDYNHVIRNFTLSPESTDCDSNEIESEFSLGGSSGSKLAQMPILEDGLSSGVPSSDSEYEFDSGNDEGNLTLEFMKKQISEIHDEVRIKYGNKSRETCKFQRNSPSHKKKNALGAATSGSLELLNNGNVLSQSEKDSFEVAKQNKLDLKPSSVSDDERSVIGKAATSEKNAGHHDDECDTDQETDRLLGAQRSDDKGFLDEKNNAAKKKNASREGYRHEPSVLIEGVLFRARYLGSTQLVCEGQPTKATRMMQAEEAVSRIKAPEGETQPSTEVDLFISTEKIMVLNTDLKEIMMDHSLRTISYIADIGDLLVLMARRRNLNGEDDPHKIKRTPKMICHVFESEEAQFIAQSIGQAFQVAYMEFLKANGIEDSSFVKEMDYQEVLNSQEIFGDELDMFAKRDRQKEVIVPKQKNEILGMVIVESGWGSMLPTVVIANMAHGSPAARCGVLNIGDQMIAINGVSLVGLPLSTCQNYIKNTKMQTAVKLTVVPCPPVVEVKIKRPDTKYQLGFSVQNGVICSLLRGGIAERGGVRVGHRIIEINCQSVVAVPHERIVNLLATSVGEICMKTMPTSMYRLLTGQETPVFI